MEKNINKQLEIIEKSNVWIKTSLEGNKAKEAYRNMVNCRRKLNKKKFALEANPAAAMFGESQAGKSYLASALLSSNNISFTFSDGKGNAYDFKNQINPRGNEMESTSIVTRFSTKYKYENTDFPLIAKMLSPTDLILVICEAYYHNLNVTKTIRFDELKDKIESFELIYASKSDCQRLITEDDILDIEDYFNDNFTKLVFNNLKDVNFFERLSAFVAKIPSEEWKDVFPLFWNFNSQLTKLFNDLIEQFKLLNFTDTIYLPIDSVLRDNGTLLDVERLDELYKVYDGPNKNHLEDTQAYIIENGVNRTVTFSKSHICALTAELIFVLQDSFIEEKPFLDKTDLLDFPGTRRYEHTNEDNITDNSLTVLFRRGKVDYLFNKYSSNGRINTLLFCQNHKQSTQSVMPEKLNRWIENMIGRTPIERESFKSPISPLFVISTWFNKDLEFKYGQDKVNNFQSLDERWEQRFSKTLEQQIFKTDTYPWLVEWTTSNKYFQNIFLLRDFDQSSETNSKVYLGYNQDKSEKEEIKPEGYPAFREDLRKSFVNYAFVKRHFANPAESWDEAASINKDGTKLIIEKLTTAANNINSARREKMVAELNEISRTILAEMLKHFHTSDKDEELQKAKNIAGDIQFKLATAFSADRIKNYGQLMKELMLDESSVLELFRKKVDALEHRDIVNMDIYSNYRIEVPVEEDDTVEKYFERLCIRYEKTTEERKEVFRAELESKEIDLAVLIKGNSDLIMNNAQQLSEALLEYWFEYITLNDKKTIQQILAADSSLDNIKDMYQKLFKKLGLSKRIAEKIRRYVDGHNKTDLPYEIVADISAELLNKCINSVGFDYLDESEIRGLGEANEKNNLGLSLEINNGPTENSVEELFTKVENQAEIMTSRPEEMKSLPSYRNYFAWSNRLKVGFVSVCDIPNYDVMANARLGKILDECKTVEYK